MKLRNWPVCSLVTVLALCVCPVHEQRAYALALPEDTDFASPEEEAEYFAGLSPRNQEEAYRYETCFLPEEDLPGQPYVGDTMPYYEDGTYYIYYLKEGGDSYRHSIYLASTEDFVTYTEYDDPVIESGSNDVQDAWVGTGSVVKVKDDYYFFYTGHDSSGVSEYGEAIMAAKGSSLTEFEKCAGWLIAPDESLGQKTDFRDPQAYYDEETDTITLTVTASQDHVARILKYTLDGNLENIRYDGIIFTDPTGDFWNLECSDTFRMGDTYYLTYSGQDDTLWYAASDSPYGPYGEARRLDGKLFYAAKHVEGPDGTYMVGWARRSESPTTTREVSAWGGNLAVQELVRKDNGALVLAPVEAVAEQFAEVLSPAIGTDTLNLEAGADLSYADAFTAYESFMLKGSFSFTGEGSFGLAFDFKGEPEKYKMISLDPQEDVIRLLFGGGDTQITETEAPLEAGTSYSFTYIQEGSVGIFYLDDLASLTVRLYGVTGKSILLFAEDNSVSFTELREMIR